MAAMEAKDDGTRASIPKAVRAKNSIMTVIFCLSLVVVSCLSFNVGIHGAMVLVNQRLDMAHLDLQALLGQIDKKERAHQRLDHLTSWTLSRNLFESHTDCLVRGAYRVHEHFPSGELIRYPDVANKSVEWVKGNCDRLYFSPQVAVSRSRARIQGGVAKVQRCTVKIARILKVKLIEPWFGDIRKWLAKGKDTAGKLSAEKSEEDTGPGTGKAGERYVQDDYNLPPLFRLVDCTDRLPCNLAYISSTKGTARSHLLSTVSQDALQETRSKVHSLDVVRTQLSQVYWITRHLYFFLTMVQLLCSVALLGLEVNIYMHNKPHQIWVPLYVVMGIQALCVIGLSMYQRCQVCLDAHFSAFLIGMGSTGLAIFSLSTILQAAIVCMYLYSMNWERAEPTISTSEGNDSAQAGSASLESASTIKHSHRRMSSDTTLHQDLAEMMGAPPETGNEEALAAGGNLFEGANLSDVEPRSERDSGSDWSVVDMN